MDAEFPPEEPPVAVESAVDAELSAYAATKVVLLPTLEEVQWRKRKKALQQPLILDDELSGEHLFMRFPRQQLAFEYADSLLATHDARVFSVELPHTSSGTRRYIVSTFDEFYRRYTMERPETRHYYEVIREGSACHLYFDLEFDRLSNPELTDTSELMESFRSLLFSAIRTRFGLHCSRRELIELDSSTEKKFSRHVILRLGSDVAWENNRECGHFVNRLLLLDTTHRLTVKNKHGKPDSFIDRSVYSRNRNFRLLGCCKAQRPGAVLRFAADNTYEVEDAHHTLLVGAAAERQLFMDCLVTNVRLSSRRRLLRCSNIAPSQLSQLPNPSFKGSLPSSTVVRPPPKYGPSPFPLVDQAIMSHVGPDGGRIRSWVRFGSTIRYNISGTRFCYNVNRAHKSNHVYYVADLQKSCYYQACLDPDCRTFRSSSWPLPAETRPDHSNRVRLQQRLTAVSEQLSDALLLVTIKDHPDWWTQP